jgi:hypothetical protein
MAQVSYDADYLADDLAGCLLWFWPPYWVRAGIRRFRARRARRDPSWVDPTTGTL